MPQSLPEIESMLAEPDGAALVGIWVTLALMAAKSSTRGYLLDRDGRAVDASAVARLSRSSVMLVDLAVTRLIELGVLDAVPYPRYLSALADFIREKCAVRPALWAKRVTLYAVYVRWCGDRNESAMERKAFLAGMEELGYRHSRSRRNQSGKQMRTIEGIAPVESGQIASHN